MKLVTLLEIDEPDLAADALKMGVQALEYLQNHSWFPGATAMVWHLGVPGVIAVFQVELQKPLSTGDRKLWVVVGDVPSAYLVVNDDQDAPEALAIYLDLMEEWATAVLRKTSMRDVFPVGAKPTEANATALSERVKDLRKMAPELTVAGYVEELKNRNG